MLRGARIVYSFSTVPVNFLVPQHTRNSPRTVWIDLAPLLPCPNHQQPLSERTSCKADAGAPADLSPTKTSGTPGTTTPPEDAPVVSIHEHIPLTASTTTAIDEGSVRGAPSPAHPVPRAPATVPTVDMDGDGVPEVAVHLGCFKLHKDQLQMMRANKEVDPAVTPKVRSGKGWASQLSA